MNDVYEAIRALPWSAHALVALAMAGGLTLWLTGRALLKPLMVAFCAVLGAAGGLAALPAAAGEGALTQPQGMGIGLVVGIVAGLLLYRSAMAIAFGVVLGAIVPLGTAAYFDYRDARGATGTESAAAEYLEREFGEIGAATEAGSEAWGVSLASLRRPLPRADEIDAPREPEEAEERESDEAGPSLDDGASLREFFGVAADSAASKWEERPAAQRTVIIGASAVGAVAGIALGLFVPAWGASAVSSMFGAAVWLPCFVWLSSALAAPWRDSLNRAPLDWLIVWGGCSLVGMTVQWTGVLRRRTKKPAA